MDTDQEIDRPDGALIADELDREIAEAEAAIALVRSGTAAVVSLTNMRYGEEVLRQLRARGADRGVHLQPPPWPEDVGCDLDVRRIDA
jgi:hypothetical protein